MDTTKDRTRLRRSQNLKHAHAAATENDREIVEQTAGSLEGGSSDAGSADRRGPSHEEARSRQGLELMSDA